MTHEALPSGEQIEIASGEQRVVVVEVGGGLRSYTVGDLDLLDGYAADEMATAGRGQVLIPWPNRIEDGCYEFGERRHQLPLNEPEARNAIHGLVRWVAWSVASAKLTALSSSTRCVRSPAIRSRSGSASSTPSPRKVCA